MLNKGPLVNRKTFIKMAAFSVASVGFTIWNSLINRQKQIETKHQDRKIHTVKLSPGIHLYDEFVLVKSDEAIVIFSNRCTHAGCLINCEINGELLCPCHGSRYNALTGHVIQGPARLPLQKIPFSLDSKTHEIRIKIR